MRTLIILASTVGSFFRHCVLDISATSCAELYEKHALIKHCTLNICNCASSNVFTTLLI